MICLMNLMFQSGLDLNVKSQTWRFCAEFRKNLHAPRQARICATHAVSVAEHISPCVADHNGEHKVKDFSCLDQFFAMAFAQLTYRESLRDIEVNLRAQARRLYHMGFRCQTISRNTLANANATRPWQIYADFAQHLIDIARPL